MWSKILLISVFTVFTLSALEQQESSCPAIRDCIEDKLDRKENKFAKRKNGKGGFPNKLREMESAGDCSEEDLNRLADAIESLKEKRVERFEKVSQCIQGNGYPGCDMPKTNDLPRVCFPRWNLFSQNRKTNRRGNGREGRGPRWEAKQQKRQQRWEMKQEKRQERWEMKQQRRMERFERKGKKACKKDICACPEAQLCHQCYEISPLHDEIHKLQFEKFKILLSCGLPDMEDEEDGPENDETMTWALTN